MILLQKYLEDIVLITNKDKVKFGNNKEIKINLEWLLLLKSQEKIVNYWIL